MSSTINDKNPNPKVTEVVEGPVSRTNFLRLTMFQVLLRIGWIFKTESVIMPAFMDLIGGAKWQLGCLPMLSRVGQAIPPLLFSDRVRNLRYKKKALTLTTTLMGSCFLVLALCWWSTDGENRFWWPWLFLGVYAVFFSVVGVGQLLFGTLTGKLVIAQQRGRLAAMGSLVGGTMAIGFAFLLLKPWLEATPPKFGMIFGFTGAAMIGAACLGWLLVESPDEEKGILRSGIEIVASAKASVLGDRNFGWLAIAAAMFGMSMTLFPHYQSIAREKLGSGFETMLYWIVAQHIGASLLAVPAGWMADQFGNRKVLRILMGLSCAAPILLIVLQWYDAPWRMFYLCIFFLLGLTPITFRYFSNYILEITSAENHPAYLSTLSCCIALPVIATSVLVGWLIGVVGLYTVFGCVLALMLAGWFATFLLIEPRHQASNTAEEG